MDVKMEKMIAKAFIYKNKRERFLFEMSKKEHDMFGELPRIRFEALCKLDRIIDESCRVMASKRFPPPAQVVEIMHKFDVGKKCYVISEYKDFDGVYVPLDLAVEKLQWNGFPSLIVGIPSGFSHFKSESYVSCQPNCFLKPAIRFDGVPWDD